MGVQVKWVREWIAKPGVLGLDDRGTRRASDLYKHVPVVCCTGLSPRLQCKAGCLQPGGLCRSLRQCLWLPGTEDCSDMSHPTPVQHRGYKLIPLFWENTGVILDDYHEYGGSEESNRQQLAMPVPIHPIFWYWRWLLFPVTVSYGISSDHLLSPEAPCRCGDGFGCTK